MSDGMGLFVVFEGGDRAGKSTQVRALAASLTASAVPHLVTHEPGDTAVGTRIRELLLDPASRLDDRCEALLYAADKAQHIHEVVRPAMAAGRVVVCDRYIDSMLAYQGAGRALAVDDLAAIARWATHDLRPDLTVLLDADPAQAVAKLASKDRLEAAGHDFHVRVRQGFLDLAASDPGHYLVLDATGTIGEIAARVRDSVAGLLGRDLAEPELPGVTTIRDLPAEELR